MGPMEREEAMGSLRISGFIGVLAIVASSTIALAADLSMPAPETPPPPIEIGSGWYLRGDIGYKMYNTPSAHFDVAGYGNMIDENITDTGTVGLGFGYRFNSYFRTDLTMDYEWPGKFHGRLPCPNAPCVVGTDYSDEYSDISAWSGLINAYLDFGHWNGFTPYVGGGVGALLHNRQQRSLRQSRPDPRQVE